MNETTTQTFQKHLFFRLFSLKNPKLAQKIQISEIDPPPPPPLLLQSGEYSELIYWF